MHPFDPKEYKPGNTLYLWWLGQPDRPVYIGELEIARSAQGVSLRYGEGWLSAGFALSEDLPLIASTFVPRERETAAGAVDDSRPDRWGERVIRFLDKPARLAVLDYLFFAGDERFGALGVSVSPHEYRPRSIGPLPQLDDVEAIDHLVRQILAGEPVPEEHRRLIAPGVTLGGARPKALLNIAGEQWVLKFNEPGESIDMPLVEHATMTLAREAGIRVAETRAIKLHAGHAIAVKRFDREAGKGRIHAISANVALKAAGEDLGYPQLAQLLRRRGITDAGIARAQMQELFRRMVFNVLTDNTDDHEKNHALLANDAGHYELSPAFDMLPSGQGLGYQAMIVGKDQADSTLTNALSQASQFGLPRAADALEQVRQVCRVVDCWRDRFAAAGVTQRDMEQLGTMIDRPFLLEQRQQFGR